MNLRGRELKNSRQASLARSRETPATVSPGSDELKDKGVCAINLPSIGAMAQQQIQLRVPPRKCSRVEIIQEAAVAWTRRDVRNRAEGVVYRATI